LPQRDQQLKGFARTLRTRQTDAEIALWKKLRNRHLAGVKFYRQRPIGPFIVDFVAPSTHLIIEVDGSQHREQAEAAERTTILEQEGFQVLRVWDNEVLTQLDSVLLSIIDAIEDSPYPNPLPSGKRE
jgi:very-short-patch-repair endonuclease